MGEQRPKSFGRQSFPAGSSAPRSQPEPDWEEILAPAEENLLRGLGNAVRSHLAQYSDALGRGVCHGDVSLDNILVSDDGLSLHDFDLSGTGYRAADFTGVASPSAKAGRSTNWTLSARQPGNSSDSATNLSAGANSGGRKRPAGSGP
ncbi:phosphotransferase [Kribbella sp. CA-293567]|uniref:phosphotransferase n=1 Tax=Kribbella sp. CA-293567 TaxID=3002436 RepID=UPI003FA5D246